MPESTFALLHRGKNVTIHVYIILLHLALHVTIYIADVKVVVETDNILPVNTLSTSIHDNILPVNTLSTSIHVCFACYYIFNISFPPSYKHILLFLEKYVKIIPKTSHVCCSCT